MARKLMGGPFARGWPACLAGILGVFALALALAVAQLWLPPADSAQAQDSPADSALQFAADTTVLSVAEKASPGASVGDPGATVDHPDTGGPRVRLAVGDKKRWARYDRSEQDGTRLIFAYRVNGEDAAAGVSIRKNALELSGGSIEDADGNAARRKRPALPDQAGHQVDGSGASPLEGLAQASALTGRISGSLPATGGRATAQVRVAFSQPVAAFTGDTPSVTVSGATVTAVAARAMTGEPENQYAFTLTPAAGVEPITFSLVAGQACDSGGICTAGGTTLATALTHTVQYRTTAPTANTPPGVPADWPLIPKDAQGEPILTPGKSFRLIFVTSNNAGGQGTDTYPIVVPNLDRLVQRAAGKNVGITSPFDFSGQFKALATGRIDGGRLEIAKANTGMTGTGVPVYWLGGNGIADDYNDFWDGAWDSNSPTNELGKASSSEFVWTGTSSSGGDASDFLGGIRVTVGKPSENGKEIDSASSKNVRSERLPAYGVSPVITVKPSVTLVVTPDAISENGGVATVTATLDQAVSAETKVAVSIAPLSPADYTLSANNILTIPASATSSRGKVTITAVDNSVAAANQTVKVAGTVNRAGVSPPASAALTITDDESDCAGSAAVGSNPSAGLIADCRTLLAAKETLEGTAKLDWSAGTAISGWEGVTVADGRVTGIHLPAMRLNGSIPRQLGSLPNLLELSLNDNALSGAIPAELASLTRLTSLNLSGNDLTGKVTLAVSPSVASRGDDTEIAVTAELDAGTAWANKFADSGSIVTVSVSGRGSSEPVVGFEAVADFDIAIAKDNARGAGAFTLKPTADSTTNGNVAITVSISGTGARGAADADLSAANEPTVTREAKRAGFRAEADDGAVVLSWTNPDDATITKWQYTQDGGTTWKDMAGSGKDTVVYRVSSLTNGTEYTFRIRAVTTAGNGAASDSASATPAAAPALQITELVTGLSIPWGLAFTPDGTMLFTQRGGGIRSFAGGTAKDVTADLTDLHAVAEVGLMGIVVDPNFSTNRRFYTCQGHKAGPSGSETYEIQVIAWTIDSTYATATRVNDPLVGGIPNSLPFGGHGGCRLRFGPDGYLWISTGDGRIPSAAQDLTSLGGKVLRVDSTTGAGAPDNPFASNANANAKLVYTYGHRNPQGLALRPGTKQMWSVEHGTHKDDEINLLASGGNYGWNPGSNPGSRYNYDGDFYMTDLTTYPDAVVARWSSGSPTLATSGGIFLEGEHWGIWEGRLAVATLAKSQLFLFHFTPDGTLAGEKFSVPDLHGTYSRLRTPMMDSDGALYITTSNSYSGRDMILRVTPARAPEFPDSIPAIAVAENTTGTAIGDPVAATDLNRDALDYSLSGADSANFTIDASTGQISATDSADLDYETTTSYILTISVTDGKDAGGKDETTATIDDSIEVTINVTDVAEVPLAPTLTSVTAASTTSLQVTWTTPDNTERPDITGYALQWKPDGQEFHASRQAAAPADATGHTIDGLRAGTAYQVRVRAVNADGNGAWSRQVRRATAADTARPEIEAGPAITSSPESGSIYAGEETIQVALTFNEPVAVTVSRDSGGPRVRLVVGERKRWARYDHSEEDGTRLIFAYRVKGNDADSDGVSIQKNALELNGGTIVDVDGNVARLKHPRLSDQAAHQVDGVKPTLTDIEVTSTPGNGHTYVMGERMTFTVSFSEPVVVRDRGHGVLMVGLAVCIDPAPGPRCDASWADNLNTSGSALRFERYVSDRETDTDGIGFPKHPMDVYISGIEDAAGNAAILTYSGSKNGLGHNVDGYTPQAPFYPEATAGDGQVTLSWTIPFDFRGYIDRSITKYQYRQKAGDGAYESWTDVPGDGATTEYTIGSLENGTTYTFQIRALDVVNTSDETEEVTATPTGD